MGVERGDEVHLDYVGRLRDGTVFDATDESVIEEDPSIPDRPSPPLTVEIGAERIVRGPGQIIQELEDHLLGLSEGETVTVTVPPEKAFGEPDEERIVTYDRDDLQGMMGDAVTADEPEAGLTVRTPDGQVGEITASPSGQASRYRRNTGDGSGSVGYPPARNRSSHVVIRGLTRVWRLRFPRRCHQPPGLSQ